MIHIFIHRYVRTHTYVHTHCLYADEKREGGEGQKELLACPYVALAGDIIINLFAHVKGNGIIYFIYVHNRCIKRLITLID